jgi:hypothetical protein
LVSSQREAQGAARRGFGGPESYEDWDSARIRERLEGALTDVLDILDGASEDVNEILGEGGE